MPATRDRQRDAASQIVRVMLAGIATVVVYFALVPTTPARCEGFNACYARALDRLLVQTFCMTVVPYLLVLVLRVRHRVPLCLAAVMLFLVTAELWYPGVAADVPRGPLLSSAFGAATCAGVVVATMQSGDELRRWGAVLMIGLALGVKIAILGA